MGQYYNAVIEINGSKDVFYHQVDGKHIPPKLMEHSYWYNPFVLAVASKLWRTKGRLAWVGDYANAEDSKWNDAFADAHDGKIVRLDLTYNGFCLENKLFVNHTTKQYIDLTAYKDSFDADAMIISPISLLTAVGNSKGNGDFSGESGSDVVGIWAWDIVEIIPNNIHNRTYDSVSSDFIYTLKDEWKDYVDITADCLFCY